MSQKSTKPDSVHLLSYLGFLSSFYLPQGHLDCISLSYCFPRFNLFILIWLSIPVQVIDWKVSSLSDLFCVDGNVQLYPLTPS